MTVSGPGSVIFSGDNSYSGATNVNGLLEINSPASLPGNSAVSIGAGGVLQLGDGIGGAIVLGGPVVNPPAQGVAHVSVPAQAVPEPGTIVLLLAGLVCGAALRLRRKGIRG